MTPTAIPETQPAPLNLNSKLKLGGKESPKVLLKAPSLSLNQPQTLIEAVCKAQINAKENPIEGLILTIDQVSDLENFSQVYEALETVLPLFVLELSESIDLSDLEATEFKSTHTSVLFTQRFEQSDSHYIVQFLDYCQREGHYLALNTTAQAIEEEIGQRLSTVHQERLLLCSDPSSESTFSQPPPRRTLPSPSSKPPKNTYPNAPSGYATPTANALDPKDYFSDRLIESSFLSGNLLCDGIGDLISVETEPDLEKAKALAYNLLQGARARITKTEFVACPSCGRTLFDLQSVTQTIRAKTDHLKGVTIAIMGCIVNGPGEMADADFGYVGGAPDKINLYIGKDCVEYNVPADQALDRLIELIKQEGKWVDPA